MSLAEVRLAMMERYAVLAGVNVPSDPLPTNINDKTIVIFPRLEESTLSGRGKTPNSVVVQGDDVMQIEYHRRIPYDHLGSTMGDITEMIDIIRNVAWSELAGGKFDGTILSIRRVALTHFGALGWNEWTFGARLEVSFTHLISVSS